MRFPTLLGSLAVSWLLWQSPLAAQDLERLRIALGDASLSDGWIFEDIDAGYAMARKTGKPLLVVFR